MVIDWLAALVISDLLLCDQCGEQPIMDDGPGLNSSWVACPSGALTTSERQEG